MSVVVSLSEEDRKVYGTFFKLRNSLPNVKIVTLRQISIYIGKSVDKLDDFDISIVDEDNYKISLIDGRIIMFSENNFGFKIIKKEANISMSVNVYEKKIGDLSSVMVYGIVEGLNNGVYVVNSINNGCASMGNIGFYDMNLGVTNSSFKIIPEIDSPFDCFDGCLGNFLTRIDLLYENMKCIVNSKKTRVKRIY